MLRKTAVYILKTVAVIAALVLLLWVVLLVYVSFNEKWIKEKVAGAISTRTKGEVTIGGLSVGLFRTFPVVSLQLEDVVVRDSLYAYHKKDLISASDVYLRAGIRGLISRDKMVGGVIIRNGIINLITDTAGNTNQFVLKGRDAQKRSKNLSMPDVVLKNVLVNLQDAKKKKHYEAQIIDFTCKPKTRNNRMRFRIDADMNVRKIAFNSEKGEYLRGKPLSGKFDLLYDSQTKKLTVKDARLNLGGHPYVFTGEFNLHKEASDFLLTIKSKSARYERTTSLLTARLEKKLNEYTISKPVDLQVQISGKTAGGGTPLIVARLVTKKATVTSPVGIFEECTINGYYTNQLNKSGQRIDENSLLHFTDFEAKWEGIGIRSKNVRIRDLINPVLTCDVKSTFNLKLLNNLTGSQSIRFLSGRSEVDVVFSGPIMKGDSSFSNIEGKIHLSDAGILYRPRNFELTECQGSLLFTNGNLSVNRLSAKAGTTKLIMNGKAENFLSMLNESPEKLALSWNIESPKVNLADFKRFLSKPAKSDEKKKAAFGEAASKVDKLFAEGDMNITLHTPEMEYKSFHATDVQASVVLRPAEIAFDKVQLKHAGGSMDVSGSLKNGGQMNPVDMRTLMRDMEIPKLFKAFQNFGQDAVTHENLRGTLSADVSFSGAINEEAQLISNENNGYINFILQNGELINFEPLLEISRKALKKQDFTHVKFADLANRLDVRGTAFIINSMDIRSTALNLSVEGVYDLKNGTDMSIRLPLNNLTKSQAGTDISDDGKIKRGVGLRLRAKTGDDGKLKISWDPFKKSIKNKSDVEDSSQVAQ